MSEELVTTEAAARELGVSRWVILKAIQRERLPATKFGRDYAIRRVDLDYYKATRRKRGRPPKGDAAPYRPVHRPLRLIAETQAPYDAFNY